MESKLWLLRGRQSHIDFSEANGWGEPGLTEFRRHIVDLGDGLLFIYDELEARNPVSWHFRLHSVVEPLTMEQTEGMVKVTATNAGGVSDAYIFASKPLDCDITSKFRIPAVDWLKNGGKERPDHSHFTAKSVPAKRMAFATVVDTRVSSSPSRRPQLLPDGRIAVGKWTIAASLDGSSYGFKVVDSDAREAVDYAEGQPTIIRDNGTEKSLSDRLPHLEM